MYAADVPYILIDEAPIALTRAISARNGGRMLAGEPPKADYLLKACHELSTLVGGSDSAERLIDPIGRVAVYYYQHLKLEVDMTGVSTSLLKGPKHGMLSSVTENVGWPMYHYDPAPGYLGKDQVTFIATYRGKTYKVVVSVLVELVTDGNAPQCAKPTLIRLTKPYSSVHRREAQQCVAADAHEAARR